MNHANCVLTSTGSGALFTDSTFQTNYEQYSTKVHCIMGYEAIKVCSLDSRFTSSVATRECCWSNKYIYPSHFSPFQSLLPFKHCSALPSFIQACLTEDKHIFLLPESSNKSIPISLGRRRKGPLTIYSCDSLSALLSSADGIHWPERLRHWCLIPYKGKILPHWKNCICSVNFGLVSKKTNWHKWPCLYPLLWACNRT